MQLDLDREEITQLLHRWGHGDDDARNEMFNKVYGKLCAAVRTAASWQDTSTAASVVHDAFVRLSRHEGATFRDRTHFAGFCAQILSNLLIDRHRRIGVRHRDTDHLLPSHRSPPEQGAGTYDVSQALSELADAEKPAADAIMLKACAGFSVEEIAAYSGCSVATVGRNLKLARFFLRARLHEFDAYRRAR